MNRWWLVIAFAVLCMSAAIVTFRAMLGDESALCGVDEAHETFAAAGFKVDELMVLEGCTRVVTGLRAGEVRGAVAIGTEDAVLEALQSGSVDSSLGPSPVGDHYILRDSFDVRVTPFDGTWHEGDRLSARDSVDFRDRPWNRYVLWGQERDGENFMIGIILEVGSL